MEPLVPVDTEKEERLQTMFPLVSLKTGITSLAELNVLVTVNDTFKPLTLRLVIVTLAPPSIGTGTYDIYLTFLY